KRIRGVQRRQILGNFNSALDHIQLQYMPLRCGIELIRLCRQASPEADGPANLEQPTLNHVQSDTLASAILES
ncbi:hypothetical protein TNCV_39991, partial [Trichonephila clavipes]